MHNIRIITDATTSAVGESANMTPIIVVAGILLLILIVKSRQGGGQVQTDPQRLFSAAQRAEAKRLAGGRCEHGSPILGIRCAEPGAHGDHIFPHSKGGATAMSNHAWLCARHNTQKGATIPTRRYIRALERRRRRYFPAGADVKVEYRLGRAR